VVEAPHSTRRCLPSHARRATPSCYRSGCIHSGVTTLTRRAVPHPADAPTRVQAQPCRTLILAAEAADRGGGRYAAGTGRGGEPVGLGASTAVPAAAAGAASGSLPCAASYGRCAPRGAASSTSCFLDCTHGGRRRCMKGKLCWFESVTVLDLVECEEEDFSGVLAEAGSMPSLRSLSLSSSCAERAVDAEAVCGLTLTTLRFYCEVDEDGEPVEEVGEWVLDLSRLTTLTALNVEACDAVTDKEVLALSNLTVLQTSTSAGAPT
jgi:hypothetical protein